jgi:hypothetical protein
MSDTPANVMTNQEQLLQENFELRQSIEALRKYYSELSKFALTIKEAKPTLTAAELEAVEWAAIRSDADAQMIGGEFYAAGQSMRARSATLRKLLERMK